MTNLRIFATAVLIAALLGGGCGTGNPGPAAPEGPTAGVPDVELSASLADALKRIELLDEARGAAALPAQRFADQAQLAGPEAGSFSTDSGAHTMTLTSQGTGPDDPLYLAFAIYRSTGHSGDDVRRLDFELSSFTGQEWWLYVVDYGLPTAAWHAFGPFNGSGPQSVDLSMLGAVSPGGNVWFAAATYGNTTATLAGSFTLPAPPPQYYEVEPNEVDGSDDDRSVSNALPAFPFGGSTVVSSLGGKDTASYDGYDEDGVDWYSFDVSAPGTVSITMQFFVNGGSGVGDLELELWDAAGASALQTSVGVETAERIDYAITTPGTYYVKCRNRDLTEDSYGDYTLWGRFWPDTLGPGERYYETEPNDAFSTADSLPALPFGDGVVNGSIGPLGGYDGSTEDWFSFTSVGPQIVTANVFADSDEATPDLAILDTDGTTVLAEQTGSGDVTTVQALVGGGTYFIRVRETTVDDGGDYELTATRRDHNPGDYYETEPNDSFGAADALPAFDFGGSTVDGSVGQGGGFNDGSPDDWFSFSVSSEQVVQFSIAVTDGTGAGEAELVDSDGTTVLGSDTSAPFDVAAVVNAGTYYLRVGSTSSGTGFDYTIAGTSDDPGAGYYEQEDNDVFGDATALPALPFTGTTVNGSMGNGGGFYDGDLEDWFSFTLPAQQTVEIVLTVDSGSASPDIELYAADGTTLLDEHRFGTEYYVGNQLAAGTYYVKVFTGSGWFEYHLEGFVHTPGGGFDETENNDTTATADVLPAFPFTGYDGSGGNAPSHYDGDHYDWFRIDVAASGTLTLDMAIADSVAGDVDMRLYESDGTTELGASTGVGDSEQIVEALTAGTYYLNVYMHRGGSDYTLAGTYL